MKKYFATATLVTLVEVAGVGTTLAAGTALPFRCGEGTCTPLLVERTFGTNILALPFSGTTNYDFYSSMLLSPISLAKTDTAGGVIFMRNPGSGKADDFSVSGRMQFFDYDPASGTNGLIVDTGVSPPHGIAHGQTVNWAVPTPALPAAAIIPSGHLLHVAVTITLVPGSASSFGQFLYNGPSGSTSIALLPENRAASWTLGKPLPANQASACASSDGCMTVTFSAIPGATYQIEATTNLIAPVWIVIGNTNADVNGLLRFVDVDAKYYSSRFYRVRQ